MTHSIQYSSPIGTIDITEQDNNITSLSFASPLKRKTDKLSPVLKKTLKQLDEYFAGKRKTFDLPINYNGTDFQKKVWKKLATIPYGETLSYAKLARTINKPKACRAVGMANNKNKIAIILPCHRVIGNDGSMVGYASGTWRKEWLLEHEHKYH